MTPVAPNSPAACPFRHTISVLLSCCSCLALCYLVSISFSQSASFGALLSTAPTIPNAPYFHVLNPSHNAFLTWRVDPFVSTLAHLLAVPPTKVFLLHATIFFLGLIFVLLPSTNRCPLSRLAATVHSLTATTFLYALFADDIIIWGSLAYLPFLMLSIGAVFSRPNNALTWFLVTIFLSLLLALSAPWSSIAIVLWAVLVTFLQSPPTLPRRLVVWVTFALLIAPLLVMMVAPLPDFPRYPPLAQVVPDDGLPGMIRPLVGPSLAIPVIDRAWIKIHYFFPTLLLTAMSLFFLVAAIARRSNFRNLALMLTLCTFCIALDIFAPESVSQVAPLAVLSRLIPGLALYPLVTLAVALIITTTLLQLRTNHFLSLCASLIALTVLVTSSQPSALLQRPDAPVVYLQNLARPPEKRIPENLIFSPSYAIYRARISSIHLNHPDRPTPVRVKARQIVRSLATSHRPELAEKLSDGSNKERWATMRGWQAGDEFIFTVFQKPTVIRGIRMSAGAFITDFPAGLKITGSTATSCEDPKEATTLYLDLPHWQGTIRRSRPSLHPFYGNQQLVRIPLPISPPLTCLKIAQTGQRKFDWSVTELSFYIEP